jgi:hypothetical protein
MEHHQRKPPVHGRTQSADSIRELLSPKETSMLFSILPTAVQTRIPKLPSLSGSVRSYGLARPNYLKSKQGSGVSTPELGYISAIDLSHQGKTEDSITSSFGGSVSSDDDCLQVALSSTATKQAQMEPGGSRAGIAWKFANQGMLFFFLKHISIVLN